MRAPLVTIGVATRSRGGTKLWELMHQTRPELRTFGTARPGEPWVAARLEIDVNVLQESEMKELMLALGDFERCLGWIEMKANNAEV
jgi:hypothetical protein